MLSSLLFVVCFLLVLHRRKHNNKTVTPGRPKEDGSRSSRAQSPGHLEQGDFPGNNHRDSEMGWRRSFSGVRAKSANAVLLTSPFCAPVEGQLTSQSETGAQSKDTENQEGGKQRPGGETEADGGIEAENRRNATDTEQAADGRNLDKDPPCVSVSADGVAYLSIGTNQNKPRPDDLNKQSTDGPGQRSQAGKVLSRISTWPLTALQWQAKCQTKEDDSCVLDVLTVRTPEVPGEVKKEFNKVQHPSDSDSGMKEKGIEENQTEDPLKMNVAHMKLGNKTASISEAHVQQLKEEPIQDSATVRRTDGENLNQEKRRQNQDLKPKDKNISASSNKAEQRNEAKRAAASRQRKENRGSGSKAPSGGTSPDDETLLSGNEYAFMDLLHEVAQNNGRWTRERWKQIHVNKQRHWDGGTEGV
ncbi:uncharacterized protein [Pempheris klunzingeri]|uniref:uncharacterized protein n=1 Tax=Pempheris klunzingeri TaxID=3127111 RepID=UPI00397E953B